MSHQIKALEPIFLELDRICPVNRPVLVDQHLVPLFERYSGKNIQLIPVPATIVHGLHIATKVGDKAIAFYKRCEVHHDKELEPACPGCQEARFNQAKELVHCLDSEEDKTAPNKAADDLLDQVMREAWDESRQALVDGWGEIWSLELLVRFRQRFSIQGASMVVAMARSSGDYSYLASQYGVPQRIIKHAFNETSLKVMKGIRERAGLPVNAPETIGPEI